MAIFTVSKKLPSMDSYTVADANGASTQVNALTQPLAPGSYTLFLVVDDGFNPVVTSVMTGPFVVVVGKAGVAPNRSTAYLSLIHI